MPQESKNPPSPRSRSVKSVADTKLVKYLAKCRRFSKGSLGGREMSHIQPQLLEKQKVRHVGGIIVAGSGVAVLARLLGDGFDHAFIVVPRGVRSEERRVGKECGS